ncbi:MAG: hypothetical protein IJX50_02775 [Clostridia bacterium]|nr:hypothetical protein [Clostridia bacterium]
MKKKILITLLFILFAIPIPISILGFLFSFVWILGSLMEGISFLETITAFLGFIILATYLFTYIFALKETRREKKIIARTFLPIVQCLLFLLFLLLLKPVNRYIDKATPYFGFTKKDFSVVEELDTHGGFQGEGSHYLILDCSGNKQKALEIIEDWNKLPLTKNLNHIMYGEEDINYEINLAKEAHIPKIENGYYVFVDSQLEGKDNSDDSELFNRSSFNFEIAIYDCDTDRMYYFEYDT